MKSSLTSIMSKYLEISSTPFKKNDELTGYFNEFANKYEIAGLKKKYPDIELKWSTGQGNWAKIPWIAFLDRRETTTTRKGVYPVILFQENMEGCYFTLNQGITEPIQMYGNQLGVQKLIENANEIRTKISELSDIGFFLNSDIDLKSTVQTAKYYEIATIAQKYYKRTNIPGDHQLLIDIDGLLEAHEKIREKNKIINMKSNWIFQANPDYYDIESAIKNLNPIKFLVNQHKNEIKKGDQVFLWVAGSQSGIIAVANVIEDPKFIEQDEEDRKYNKEKDMFEGSKLRAKLEIFKTLKN